MMLKNYLTVQKTFLWTQELFCVSKNFCIMLRWHIKLKLIQLQQQKTELPFIILIKRFETNTPQAHKRYMEIFESEINNLRIQILASKMTCFTK